MTEQNPARNRRILVIDDNTAIHDDFRKILVADGDPDATLQETEAALFGDAAEADGSNDFEVDSAYQGQEGLELIRKAIRAERPYAMAFVDVRMPPGWDGIETTTHLWEEDPDLQVVICTAYSDYTWAETVKKLPETDRFLILKKPFDNVEVRQLAAALTEKWNLARQARIQMEQLEKLVDERTAQLRAADERAKQRQDELAHAYRLSAMGEMAAGIAHELNQPLHAILNYVEACRRRMMSGDKDTGQVVHDLELISRMAERAGQIIHRLRMLANKRPTCRSSLDVNEVVREAVSILDFEARRQDVRIHFDLIPRAPVVLADAILIQQVIINLIQNALHAMDGAESGTREVKIGTRMSGDDTVEVAVCDTGPGVPAAVSDRLFEPFFTTRPEGLGLGLSISRSIVEAHGGHLEATPNRDRGMTFRFTLPVAEESQQHECSEHSLCGR
mgnify:CR=1 FL=1